jgi:hypothetical protein
VKALLAYGNWKKVEKGSVPRLRSLGSSFLKYVARGLKYIITDALMNQSRCTPDLAPVTIDIRKKDHS